MIRALSCSLQTQFNPTLLTIWSRYHIVITSSYHVTTGTIAVYKELNAYALLFNFSLHNNFSRKRNDSKSATVRLWQPSASILLPKYPKSNLFHSLLTLSRLPSFLPTPRLKPGLFIIAIRFHHISYHAGLRKWNLNRKTCTTKEGNLNH